MLTSVIIPAHNEEKYIARTIASFALNHEPHELIVVANGCDSSDNTAQIAEDLGARVIELEEGNVSTARNRGAKVAEGEILIFNDADTIVAPTYVEKIAELIYDGRGDYGSSRVKADSWKPSALFYAGMINFGTIALGEICGNMFVRTDNFESVGGYDQKLFKGEDTEFGTRLKKDGAKVKFLLGTHVIPSSRTVSMKRVLSDSGNYVLYKIFGDQFLK